MYISFDEANESVLAKECETCFEAGSNDEKLAQYITDARAKHEKNASALRITVALFEGDEPKRRLHGKVAARLEQERKWVKHYDRCIAEHKKGQIVARLKKEITEAKKAAIKARTEFEAKAEEIRKQCRIENRTEFEAELKAKNKAKAKEPKKGFWHWLGNLFKDKEAKPKPKPKPAPMVAVTATPTANTPSTSGMSARQKREFYMKRLAERKAAEAKAA